MDSKTNLSSFLFRSVQKTSHMLVHITKKLIQHTILFIISNKNSIGFYYPIFELKIWIVVQNFFGKFPRTKVKRRKQRLKSLMFLWVKFSGEWKMRICNYVTFSVLISLVCNNFVGVFSGITWEYCCAAYIETQ